MFDEKIAALATPPGEGGIAIVRLSGVGIIELVNRNFIPFNRKVDLTAKKGYTLTLGWMTDAGEKIDEVLVSIMRTPHSYTGEDVVEINCHGGALPARRCLELMLKQGVRLAQPGEFTRRAFLNGRIDLSQAEAVVDIIKAKTERGLKLAVRQLQGSISEQVKKLEDWLVQANALIEASMDFPDEVGELDYAEVENILQQTLHLLDKVLTTGHKDRFYQDGVRIVICGKPNVGKSSLLNALMHKDRAIVTDIPGTTRDVIEDYLNIRGIPVKLLDTAGIRDTEDVIEQIGVQKSQAAIESADLIIFLLDVTTGISVQDMAIYETIKDKNCIVLVNKEDLDEKKISADDLIEKFPQAIIIHGSVNTGIGLTELEDAVEAMVLQGQADNDGMEIMLNLRQENALQRAENYVKDLLTNLRSIPLDCMGVDAWGALECLGEITGKGLKEEVIDRIFSEFCIGK